jgi:uncharacterized protein YnzC (UPF0291/DUF896 family)
MVANTDNLILSRLITPGGDALSSGAAEGLLSIRFKPQDVERMNELAALARERSLTPDERQEMESYNRIGHFLALIHSKARIALKATEGATGG